MIINVDQELRQLALLISAQTLGQWTALKLPSGGDPAAAAQILELERKAAGLPIQKITLGRLLPTDYYYIGDVASVRNALVWMLQVDRACLVPAAGS